MASILLKNITQLATMDGERREVADAWILIGDQKIAALGSRADPPPDAADRIIDLSNHVVLPGLVNTHHHMYQSLTRALAQDAELFDWLRILYPIWGRLRGEACVYCGQAGDGGIAAFRLYNGQ